jgi:hypothetical protein
MNKIVVQLPANRDYAGHLEIQNAAGQRIAGPFPACGRADDESAQNNKNPGRNPLLPFGDIPFGEYQIVKIMPSGPGTAYHAEEFGSAGILLMRPKLGDAALADANGRFGFFIQGGARTRNGLLRPTQDGSLRLSDRDQRRFISALRKAGDINCFCLVVSTAKIGTKVAVAKVPAGKARRNTPASLLLASSVIASTVTGVVRQAWVRTMFHAAGTSIASGLAFVAADHASAQSKGDYTPTGGAADQLNTAEQHSQDATHAATDEQVHDQAAQGFDTPASVAPPVDLHDKQGVVTPDAASGGSPPASAAGLAPGSPIVTEPEPATTPEETPATSSTPPENQPEDQNMQDQTAPMENPAPPATPSQETEPQVAPAEPSTTPAETQPDSSAAPENPATAPATPANVVVPAAAAAAGAVLGSAILAPSGSTTTPAAQEPASQAIIEHDTANPQPTPQPGTPNSDFSVHGSDTTANNLPLSSNPQNPAAGANLSANINPDPRAVAAAAYATDNATPHGHEPGTYGDQQCATYVTEALTESGIKLNKNVGGYGSDGHGYAKNLGPVLTDAGFSPVFSYSGSQNLDLKNYTPQKGDVAVIQPPTKNDPAGHTAIFNGQDWVSDFVQDDQRANFPKDISGGLYPGQAYRDNHPAFQIYRLPSSGGK